MKKTILAVVTSSLLAASANAATVYDKDGQQVDLYGNMRYMFGQYDTNDSGKADNFNGYSRVRLGTNLKWATGYNDVSLIGKYEGQFASQHNDTSTGDTSDNNNFRSRYAYIGADFGNGIQAIVGSIGSPFNQLKDITDIYEYNSGNIEDNIASDSLGTFSSDIWDDSIGLSYTADGWDLRTAVSFSDQNKTRTWSNDTGEVDEDCAEIYQSKLENAYGASAGYTFQIDDVSSIKPVLAYQAFTGRANNGENYTNQQYSAGIGYTYDAFYLGTSYGQAKYEYSLNEAHPVTTNEDALKLDIWSTVASYNITPEWQVLTSYGIVDPHNAGASKPSKPSGQYGEYYTFGTSYNITPKAKVFAEYELNQTKGYDDTYLFGAVYSF